MYHNIFLLLYVLGNPALSLYVSVCFTTVPLTILYTIHPTLILGVSTTRLDWLMFSVSHSFVVNWNVPNNCTKQKLQQNPPTISIDKHKNKFKHEPTLNTHTCNDHKNVFYFCEEMDFLALIQTNWNYFLKLLIEIFQNSQRIAHNMQNFNAT